MHLTVTPFHLMLIGVGICMCVGISSALLCPKDKNTTRPTMWCNNLFQMVKGALCVTMVLLLMGKLVLSFVLDLQKKNQIMGGGADDSSCSLSPKTVYYAFPLNHLLLNRFDLVLFLPPVLDRFTFRGSISSSW